MILDTAPHPFSINTFLEVAGVMFVGLDANGKVTLINRKGCDILGWTEEEIIGKNWHNHFLPKAVRVDVKSVFRKLMKGQVQPVEYFENPIKSKDGTEHTIAWHNTILKDRDGKIAGTLSSGEDITERKKAVEALQRNQELLKNFMDAATDGFTIWDSKLRLIDINKTAAFYLPKGMTKTDVIGKMYVDLRPNSKANGRFESYLKVMETGVAYCEDNIHIPTKHGARVVSSRAFKVGDGLGIATTDMTERVRSDDALRKSEERFRTFARISPVGIFVTDAQGHTEYWNNRLREISGIKTEKYRGGDWFTGVHPDDRERVLCEWFENGKNRATFNSEFRFLDSDGQVTWAIGQAVPILDSQDETIGYVGTITDISEQKKAEDQIMMSLEEKEVLLREIHHRVKNNLNVVTSLLNLQALKSQGNEQALHPILESVNRIHSMSLVHDQLYKSDNFSRIRFREYIEAMSRELLLIYDVNGIVNMVFSVEEIELDINTAIPCGLILNEVLTNILKYAFIGRNNGKISISVKGLKNGNIRLEIKDNGVGSDENQSPEKSSSLGLELIDILTLQIGGSIRVKRNQGTTFQITFPRDQHEAT